MESGFTSPTDAWMHFRSTTKATKGQQLNNKMKKGEVIITPIFCLSLHEGACLQEVSMFTWVKSHVQYQKV